MKQNTRHRRYQITINNPGESWTHEAIRAKLESMKLKYYCMADEKGIQEQTPHTHVYFVTNKSAIRFTTVKNLFPTAHIEPAQGTSEENRAYIQKSGKWAEGEKSETTISGTFEEWGECPKEQPGERTDLAMLYQYIKDGLSDYEIMEQNPEYILNLDKIERARQAVREEEYREKFRHLKTVYIWGPTGTGKTRGVMESHGYTNVYRVTDYRHPFDRYDHESVLCLDEYRSNLPIGDMLNYLDGYPLLLPARYANRVACYEVVYIVSNIDLKEQYLNVQKNESKTWEAFLRRIDHVIEYRRDAKPIEHGSGQEYICPAVPEWKEIPSDGEQEELPFLR